MAALPWSLIALLPWLLVWLLLWPREELRGLFVPYVSSTSAQCGKLLGRRGEEADRRWRILTGLKPRMLMALHVNVWATVSAQPWFSRVGFSGKIWAWMLSFVAVRGVFGWLPLGAQHWLPSNRFLLLRWAAGRLARDASPFHRDEALVPGSTAWMLTYLLAKLLDVLLVNGAVRNDDYLDSPCTHCHRVIAPAPASRAAEENTRAWVWRCPAEGCWTCAECHAEQPPSCSGCGYTWRSPRAMQPLCCAAVGILVEPQGEVVNGRAVLLGQLPRSRVPGGRMAGTVGTSAGGTGSPRRRPARSPSPRRQVRRNPSVKDKRKPQVPRLPKDALGEISPSRMAAKASKSKAPK